MNKNIETIRTTRLFLIDMLKEISVEQLNEVPHNFNNNIIWNLAHLVAAQQGLCYLRAGLKPVVETSFTDLYKSGTKPEQFVDAGQVEIIKEKCISSLDRLGVNYDNAVFNNYPSWTSRYGVTINNIDDAIGFLGFHEGIHFGAIQALKRNLKK